MSRSFANPVLGTPQNDLPSPSGRSAKAEIRSELEAREFYGLLKETARKVYGKQGLAAEQAGKTEGNFSTAIDSGTLRASDMVQLGPHFMAELGKEMVERYAPLATPAARLRQQIKVCERALDEIRQGLEEMAS